jgi:hypothetical protein
MKPNSQSNTLLIEKIKKKSIKKNKSIRLTPDLGHEMRTTQ